MTSRVFYLIPPAIFLILAGMLFWGLQREAPDALPSSFIGRAAPELQVEPLNEHPALTYDLLMEPQIKIVNFWASWCAPCRVEHPNIQALADMGYAVYGVNYKDRPQQAEAFLDELGNPYTAIGSDAGRTGIEWGVYGVPETYVIGTDGKIILRHAGPVTGQVLRDVILPTLSR